MNSILRIASQPYWHQLTSKKDKNKKNRVRDGH